MTTGSTTLSVSSDDFLKRFKDQARDSFKNAYEMQRSVHVAASSGALSTWLAQDVASLLETQRYVLQEHLERTNQFKTTKGRAMYLDGLHFIVCQLKETHTRQRPLFFGSLDECCAAANDYARLADSIEQFEQQHLGEEDHFLQEKRDEDEPHNSRLALVQTQLTSYVCQLSQDAVWSAERAHIFIVRTLNQSLISSDLFSVAWEADWTHNEVLQALIQLIDPILSNIQTYLGASNLSESNSAVLYNKTLLITTKALVCFYVRCLVETADSLRGRRPLSSSRRQRPFEHTERALLRMKHDIDILHKYLVDKKCKHCPVTSRMVHDELYVLYILHECLQSSISETTGEPDTASLDNFIVIIHKRIGGGHAQVTRHFLRDLLVLLVSRDALNGQRRQLDTKLVHLEPDLQRISNRLEEQQQELVSNNSSLPKVGTNGARQLQQLSFVRLDEMLKVMYEDRILQNALRPCLTCVPTVKAPRRITAQRNDDANKDREVQPVVANKLRAITQGIRDELRLWGGSNESE